jgi:flavodoxin
MPDRASALIVYESLFGNTEQIAETIYDGLRTARRRSCRPAWTC